MLNTLKRAGLEDCETTTHNHQWIDDPTVSQNGVGARWSQKCLCGATKLVEYDQTIVRVEIDDPNLWKTSDESVFSQ